MATLKGFNYMTKCTSPNLTSYVNFKVVIPAEFVTGDADGIALNERLNTAVMEALRPLKTEYNIEVLHSMANETEVNRLV